MSTPVLETVRLTKRFRRVTAVEDFDLSLEPGQALALLGPNGAGKTTALRLMAGILAPTAGQVRVFGRPVADLGRDGRAQLGYVSESQETPEWMTPEQLLRFLAPMYPTWDRDLEARLRKLFALPMDRRIRNLSRGQRMKTAFLSSLCYRPRLLLLDEPFGGLDSLVREELLDALVGLTAQDEWSILMASHDMEEVERLADGIAWMDESRLRLQESVGSLQDRFRRVTCLLPPEVAAGPMPDHWSRFERHGRAVAFLDTAFDEAGGPDGIRSVLPGAANIEITPLTLREIHLAMLREYRAESDTGESRRAS